MKHSYSISGMTCSGCQAKVQHLLSSVSDVKNVSINLQKGEAEIEMNTHIATEKLQAALKAYPKYNLAEKIIFSATKNPEIIEKKNWIKTYKPIFLIFGYLSIIALLAGNNTEKINFMETMRIFMGGFFLVFSFFKLLDIKGFAESYAMYDIVAKRWKYWGFIYVFIEVGLGFAYAINVFPIIINTIMLVVMTISIVGVIQSVMKKTTIRCACLGAVFNLPMSTVTIIEDGLMILMGILMLLFLRG